MGTSMGAAIDYVLASLRSGVTTPDGVVVPPLTAVDPSAAVYDNTPASTSETQVVVGRTSPDSGAAGDVDWEYTTLGAARIEESYTIPGYIAVWRPGPDQKPARDAAIALTDGVVRLIHADPTLGLLLQMGRIARVAKVVLHQTQDDEDTAGGGYMYACVDFELAVQNTYIP